MSDEREMRTLLRCLVGEMSAAERRRLEAELAADPELRLAAERLERIWKDLEAPSVAVPPSFAAEVMDRVVGVEPEAPAWARVAAAAALIAGIALGVGLGGLPPGESPALAMGPAAPTFAELYLSAVAELDRQVAE